MEEKQWTVYLDANTMTTLLQILYTESQGITPTLMSQSMNLGVERSGRLGSSYHMPLVMVTWRSRLPIGSLNSYKKS